MTDSPSTSQYYRTIPAQYFAAQPSAHNTSPYPSGPSYHTARGYLASESSNGSLDGMSIDGEDHGRLAYVDDDETMARMLQEEEFVWMEVEWQRERDLRQALDESRRMAIRDAHAHRPSNARGATGGQPPRTPTSRREPERNDETPTIAVPPLQSLPTRTERPVKQRISPRDPQISGSRLSQTFHSLPQQSGPLPPLLQHRHLLTGERKCPQCEKTVPSPGPNRPSALDAARGVPLGSLLHLICGSCSITICRGCSKPTECLRSCTGGRQCTLYECCSHVRAIAIFELLVDFDNAFADKVLGLYANSPLQRISNLERRNFLEFATTDRKSSLSRDFTGILLATLEKATRWLAGDLHPCVPQLISTSHLLEALHSFVSVSNAGDWLARYQAYTKILDFLKSVAKRPELHDLVMGSFRVIEWTCELRTMMWSSVYLDTPADSSHSSISIYEVVGSEPSTCSQRMRRYAQHAHSPRLAQDAQELWQGLKYLELLKLSGPDTN